MKIIKTRDAHKEFIDFLKSKKHSSATVLAYGKDIDQLTSFLEELEKRVPYRDIWICGGARTFEHFMPFVQRMYISRIPWSGQADRFFPAFAGLKRSDHGVYKTTG